MFTIDIKTLKTVLKNIAPLTKDTQIPFPVVFSNIGIEYNTITASYVHHIETELLNNVRVSYNDLKGIISLFDAKGVACFTLIDDNTVEVTGGITTTRMNTVEIIIERGGIIKGPVVIQLDSFLLKALAGVNLSAAQKDIRYYLNGVCFIVDADGNLVDLVSTDGHCLSRYTNSAPNGECFEYILDSATVAYIINNNASSISFEKADASNKYSAKALEVTSGDFVNVLLTKTIDGKFPDYNRVIPKYISTLWSLELDNTTIKKLKTFADNVLKNTSKMKSRYPSIFIASKENKLVFKANLKEGEFAQELYTEIEYTDEAQDILLGAGLLSKFVGICNKIGTESVVLNVDADNSQLAVCAIIGGSFTYVAMPMRQ